MVVDFQKLERISRFFLFFFSLFLLGYLVSLLPSAVGAGSADAILKRWNSYRTFFSLVFLVLLAVNFINLSLQRTKTKYIKAQSLLKTALYWLLIFIFTHLGVFIVNAGLALGL